MTAVDFPPVEDGVHTSHADPGPHVGIRLPHGIDETTATDYPGPVFADPGPQADEDRPGPSADTGPQEQIAPRIPAPAGEPSSVAWDVYTDWADAYLTGGEDDYELIRLHNWLVRFADELQTLASEGRRTPVRRLRARDIPFREIGLAVKLDDKMIRKLNGPCGGKDQAE